MRPHPLTLPMLVLAFILALTLAACADATTSVSTTTAPGPTTTIVPLSVPTAPAVSATELDVGQVVTFSTYASNGIAPYTYNFIILTSNGAIIAFSGPQSANSVSYPPPAAGSFIANVVVTDNELSPETTASGYSQIFTVSPAPAATSLAPSSNSIALGEGVTFNVLVSGGAGPFVLDLVSSAGVTVSTVTAGAGYTTFGKVFPDSDPSAYSVTGIDTGTTNPFVFNSSRASVNVSNVPTTIATTTVSIGTPTTSMSPTIPSPAPTATTIAAAAIPRERTGDANAVYMIILAIVVGLLVALAIWAQKRRPGGKSADKRAPPHPEGGFESTIGQTDNGPSADGSAPSGDDRPPI